MILLECIQITFNTLLKNTIYGCLGQTHRWLVDPRYSITIVYGEVKCHKEGAQLRPIGIEYIHLVGGAKKIIKKILKPLASEFIFSVDSQ